MAEYTEHYNFKKPTETEYYNIKDANTNNTMIDIILYEKVDKIPNKSLSTNDFTDGYKKKIDSMQTLYRFKGTVTTTNDLSIIENANVGDVYKCEENLNNYCWNGRDWIELGQDTDFSNILKRIDDFENQVNEKISKSDALTISPTEPTGVSRKKIWIQKGKNLFNGKYNTGFGYSQTAGEQIVLANVYSNKNIMSIPLNATKICLSKNGVGISARFFFYDSDKNFITSIAVFDPPYIIDIPQNARYCNCQTGKDNANNEFINIQIETGMDDSTLPTAFEEYITPSIYVKNDDDTYEEIIEQTYLSREEHNEDMKHKVDKIEGKVLSTNDFTNAYKTKLDGIETGANKIITKTATTKTHTNNPNDNTKVPNIGFLSYWNGAHNASNTSNITYCYEGEIQAKPTILYDNASGSNGTITLSQTAGNFKFLRICYLRDSSTATEKEYASVVVYWPNNKNVGLYVNHATGNVFQMYGTRIKIYGTSITHVQGDMLAINKTVGIVDYETNNHLKIVSVLGYK